MTESGVDSPVSEAVDAVGGRLQQRCAPCWLDKKTIPASVYCKNCKEFLCMECTFYHKRFSFMSDHDIVDTHQADPGEQDVKMYGYDKCSVHCTSVEIYCEDHDVFICAKCAFSDHKRCENAKNISEFSIDMTLDAFKEKITACCETALKFIESVNEIGSKEKEKGRAKAEQIKSEFCEKIEKELAEFVNEIDYIADSARSSFQYNVDEVSNIHLELEMWMKNLSAAIQNGLSVESFILCKSLKTNVMKREEFLKQQVIEDTYITTCINTEPEFNKTIDITVQVNSSDFEHQDEDSKFNTVSRTIVAVNRKAMVPVKIYSDKAEPLISGIDFLDDRRLMAIDCSNNKCFVFDEHLQVLGKPFTCCTKPFDMCVYKENQAAITSRTKVMFISVTQCNDIRLIRKVSTSASYFSISRFNCSMFLCSSYNDTNAPVRVVDFDGKETNFNDIVFPKTHYKLNESFSMYAEHLGIIILADYDSHKVYMFNTHTGEKIVVEDQKIKNPKRICMGPGDTVFISCERNIVSLSLDGHILQTIDVIQYPDALRMSKDGTKLVVSNRSKADRQIQLYELTCIHPANIND